VRPSTLDGLFVLTSFSVSTVAEEEDIKVPDENGNDVVVPINMAGPNPNEVEFDNLYLDMNGIVCFVQLTMP
jgi:5'-3' exonuclease